MKLDAVADSRKRNVEGQMGLFALLGQDEPGISVPIPDLEELPVQERMAMEKEAVGLYLSGHPMDDYRKCLKNARVVPIGQLLNQEEGDFQDGQVISVAGVVQAVKLKTTKNNSSMAYVTLEDDTGSMELLAFSRILEEFGGLLKENKVIVVIGKLSLRDDKDPQMLVNRVRPISDYEKGEVREEREPAGPKKIHAQRLYLRLPNEQNPIYRKVKAILGMFPGTCQTILYFEDTKVRRGTFCGPEEIMLEELCRILGEGSVVLK